VSITQNMNPVQKKLTYIPSSLSAVELPGHGDSYHPEEFEHQKLVVEAINEQIYKRKEYFTITAQISQPKKGDPKNSLNDLQDFKEESELEEEELENNPNKPRERKGYLSKKKN